ncbi:MAG TPA: SIR2 family protein [Kofleriaceae bacterium]|nr:SIR2 family protein [Kofleriaceae bacterium]
MIRDRTQELADAVGTGNAILFTGAGFSAEAHCCAGTPLPDSAQMARDLWAILFPGEEPDESTLADLYDIALVRAPDALREYVATHLRIGDAALPDTFRAWFSAPWHRIYTLNVDDLEHAVARQFGLPRRLRTVSALATPPPPLEDALDVIHLNGIAGDVAKQVTFSTMQYAARLARRDKAYERLVGDLGSHPIVFVGTKLDETVLWQHVELEGSGPEGRPHSFIVTPSLSRARQILLEQHHIHWVQATAAEIAERLLQRI